MPRHRQPTVCARSCAPLAFLFLFAGSQLQRSTAGEHEGIPWRSSYDSAYAESKDRGIPLWVQFTGPWCGSCVRMDREVFNDPELAKLARERFVPVKLRSDECESLAAGFGVDGLPSSVVVAPTGEIVAKREGFANVTDFRVFLIESENAAGMKLKSPIDSAAERAGAGSSTSEPARIALAGYCPVVLVDARRLEQGNENLKVVHSGLVFRFATPAGRSAFLAQPERYVPSNMGKCLVSRQLGRGEIDGSPRFGAVYRDRLFVFSGVWARTEFLKDPARFLDEEPETKPTTVASGQTKKVAQAKASKTAHATNDGDRVAKRAKDDGNAGSASAPRLSQETEIRR